MHLGQADSPAFEVRFNDVRVGFRSGLVRHRNITRVLYPLCSTNTLPSQEQVSGPDNGETDMEMSGCYVNCRQAYQAFQQAFPVAWLCL